MIAFQRTPMPKLYLFLLTLRSKGKLENVYSLGENVDDALQRYRDGIISRKENPDDFEFLAGDFANPHFHMNQLAKGSTTL